MERHVLESLLAGDDEPSVIALATLRSGATYWVAERAQPAGRHAGVYKHRLQCGCTGSNLLGWNEQCSSSANRAGPYAQG